MVELLFGFIGFVSAIVFIVIMLFISDAIENKRENKIERIVDEYEKRIEEIEERNQKALELQQALNEDRQKESYNQGRQDTLDWVKKQVNAGGIVVNKEKIV